MSRINDFLKNNGWIFPSAEIYGGNKGLYDYGPLGALLKKNIQRAWENYFVLQNPDVYLLDGCILGNEKIWKASKHLENFNDILVDCKKCKKRFREEHLPGDKKCPECGGNNWTSAKPFNLIFKTNEDYYLRPETAQNIFVNFKNIQRFYSAKVPFGIAQIGKSFRNEITLASSIFRTKEFEQMECEWFVTPTDVNIYFKKCLDQMKDFLICILGFNENSFKFVEIKEQDRAHYSKKSMDIIFEYEWGWGELWGLANRGDFDLSAHQEYSGRSMEYCSSANMQKFIPHVIEHSVGINRLMYALITNSLKELPERTVLSLREDIAPYKFAVLPLTKEEIFIAHKIHKRLLEEGISAVILKKGSIGKRYKQNDEWGTPYCITMDKASRLNDSNPSFTIRDRDTTKQITTDWNSLKANGFKVAF